MSLKFILLGLVFLTGNVFCGELGGGGGHGHGLIGHTGGGGGIAHPHGHGIAHAGGAHGHGLIAGGRGGHGIAHAGGAHGHGIAHAGGAHGHGIIAGGGGELGHGFSHTGGGIAHHHGHGIAHPGGSHGHGLIAGGRGGHGIAHAGGAHGHGIAHAGGAHGHGLIAGGGGHGHGLIGHTGGGGIAHGGGIVPGYSAYPAIYPNPHYGLIDPLLNYGHAVHGHGLMQPYGHIFGSHLGHGGHIGGPLVHNHQRHGGGHLFDGSGGNYYRKGKVPVMNYGPWTPIVKKPVVKAPAVYYDIAPSLSYGYSYKLVPTAHYAPTIKESALGFHGEHIKAGFKALGLHGAKATSIVPATHHGHSHGLY